MNDKKRNGTSNPEVPAPNNNHQPKKTHKKKKKKKNKFLLVLKKLVTIILTTLLSLFLIMVITGTIVATALTVYVLDFMEETTGITIQELELSSNSYVYGYDSNNELVVLHEVSSDIQRIPITIDEIPQHVRDAFVYTEDERFYSHDGVDYKRTFAAFLNMFINIYNTDQGGSTITQQLVKNLTGDDERSPSRKIREIFRAMQLEKNYSKDEILETYLNYIGFGGPINGIQLASLEYFGKDVGELTVAEAATLAAIPKSPNYFGPFVYDVDSETGEITDGKANNKERQQYVLWQMYKNGALTYDEYQIYLNEKLIYTDSDEYKKLHPDEIAKELEESQADKPTSWIVDAAIYEFSDILEEMYNIDEEEAIKRFNSGGYQIYTTANLEMQEYIDNKFLDLNNMMDSSSVTRWIDLDGDGEYEEDTPQVGFAAIDYKGNVLALGGAIGEKTSSLSWNYATTETRQVGSTIKPVSTYGLALYTDMIHWGSYYQDRAFIEVDGEPWPTNYSTDGHFSVSGESIPVYYALQKSYNTVPAKLCQDLGIEAVFDFCTENLGMNLDPEDEAYSPLSVGALTWGISIENLTNAFVPYGNGGTYYEAHIVSKVSQANRVVYENNGNPHEAVDSETAWVMNRLLKNVVDNGTGTAAQINGIEICGKTGTTNSWHNLTFVGMAPDFVSGVWMGYRTLDEDNSSLPASLKSAKVWNNIIGEYIASHVKQTTFTPDEKVVQAPMCSISGNVAASGCPHGVIGYWKSSNAPVCDGSHAGTTSPTDTTETTTENTTDVVTDVPVTEEIPTEAPPVVEPEPIVTDPPVVEPEPVITDPPVVEPEPVVPEEPPVDENIPVE